MGSTKFKLLGQIKVKSRNNPDFLKFMISVTGGNLDYSLRYVTAYHELNISYISYRNVY